MQDDLKVNIIQHIPFANRYRPNIHTHASIRIILLLNHFVLLYLHSKIILSPYIIRTVITINW